MSSKQTKPNSQLYKNPIETLDSNSFVKSRINKRTALFETQPIQSKPETTTDAKTTEPTTVLRKEFQLYSKDVYFEQKQRYEIIKNLSDQIRQEIKVLKTKSNEFNAEVEEIEKHTLQSLPEKPGVYHIRYLEILLEILKGLRQKVGEANTWLAALQSKKKKRGSLFLCLTKKKGTQYSLSQELTNARNVA